jgi:AcrR family transcriptional regulator
MTSSASPPRDAVRTRRRILEGASDALQARGFGSTTVQNILDASGVSRRTFYVYFRSKEDVLSALYRETADELAAAVRAGADREEDPARRLFAGIDAYLDHQRDGGQLLVLLQAEAIRPDSMNSEYRETILAGLVEFVDTGVREATGVALDTLVYRSLLLAMEGLVIDFTRAGPFGAAERERVGRIMRPLFLQVLMGASYLPKAEDGQ